MNGKKAKLLRKAVAHMPSKTLTGRSHKFSTVDAKGRPITVIHTQVLWPEGSLRRTCQSLKRSYHGR